MYFNSHLSDDSAQNEATTFEHIKKFIHWMYKNKLLIKYGMIYDTIYGCRRQYRRVNSMWLLSVLVFTNRVIIYRCIIAPGHGRSKIYGINRSKKT